MSEPKLSLVVVTGHLSRALDGFNLAMDELAALAEKCKAAMADSAVTAAPPGNVSPAALPKEKKNDADS